MPGKKQSRKEGNKSAYIVLHDGEAGNVIVATKEDDASNNSGQHVFPGGTDKKLTIEENAAIELRDELGISIVPSSAPYLVDHGGARYPIISKISNPNITSGCGALFLEVSVGDLQGIAENFTPTKEIASIEVCSKDQAMEYFRKEHDDQDKSRQTGWFTMIALNVPGSSTLSVPSGPFQTQRGSQMSMPRSSFNPISAEPSKPFNFGGEAPDSPPSLSSRNAGKGTSNPLALDGESEDSLSASGDDSEASVGQPKTKYPSTTPAIDQSKRLLNAAAALQSQLTTGRSRSLSAPLNTGLPLTVAKDALQRRQSYDQAQNRRESEKYSDKSPEVRDSKQKNYRERSPRDRDRKVEPRNIGGNEKKPYRPGG